MKILFVCLGNICRSPLAEGIFRDKAGKLKLDVEIDSAGTGAWHAGENPDPRAVATARKFGVDISKLVARQFISTDLDRFDRVYVMDRSNYSDVLARAKNKEHEGKVELLLNVLHPGKNRDVPDPWYGGAEGFTEVYKLIDAACDKLAKHLLEK